MAPSSMYPGEEVVIPLLDFSTVLSFTGLSYSVQQGREGAKTLLDNVSGSFRSGRLVAVLGPSGAGKSTLLNVLSGFKAKGVKGQILINNESVERERYRQLVAYNAQDVKLLPNITAEETLKYTADLKMSSEVSSSKKMSVIKGIVGLLGLENCMKTQARLLSGGERKRLSIGQELVSNPRILFFDEPTSGLDSESSYQVISYMKDLAKQGRCVISVIHQPSSELLELFDDVYLVAGGHCLYRGSLDNLIPTLTEAGFVCPQYYNRADFAIKIASKSNKETEKVDQLIQRMKLDPECEINGNKHPNRLSLKPLDENEPQSQYPISQWRQFAILTRRNTLGTVRNFTLTVLRFIGHLVFGLIIGTVYYDIGNDAAKILSNIGFIMLTLLFIVFANAMSVVLTFPLEMAVFIREYRSNSYSIVAYFCSKIVADFPLMLAGITMFHGTAYFLTGQSHEPLRMALFWAMCVGMGWFAQVYGLLGGSIFPIEVSPFIIPVTMLPGVLFCGFFIRYDELFAAFQPLTFVSPFRFTFEGASLALYGFGRKDLGCSEMFCYYRKAAKILDMLDMKDSNFWIDVGGLGVVIFLLHVALYISLRLRVR